MDVLVLTYEFKEGLVVRPKIYLGGEIKKYQVQSGKSNYIMSSTQYVKISIKTVDGMLQEKVRALRHTKLSAKQPLPLGYRPELEQSYELGPDLALRYLQLIRILR